VFDGNLFFTEKELKQVIVLFEPLFPANHEKGIPGATDAKAAKFLSQLLALGEEEYFKIPIWRTVYREGLPLIDKASQKEFSNDLISLSFEEAHKLVERLEKGQLVGLPDSFNQNNFFDLLLEHCLKGCFSDPRWGGNSNGIMWKWLGWIEPAQDIKF